MKHSTIASTCTRLAFGILCVLGLGFYAESADAQCAFARPKKASTYQVSLVPAFMGCASGTCFENGDTCRTDADCGGQTPICEGSLGNPNASTEGGPQMIACQAPQVWSGGAWFWDSTSTFGRVQIKPGKNKIFDQVVTDLTARDLAVEVALAGVRDSMGNLASGAGQLVMVLRWTLQDRVNGDMTIVDLPLGGSLQLSGGKLKARFSANEILSDLQGGIVAGLPGCTVTQVLKIEVRDNYGVPFAAPGLL
jgi:hypothetical protein